MPKEFHKVTLGLSKGYPSVSFGIVSVKFRLSLGLISVKTRFLRQQKKENFFRSSLHFVGVDGFEPPTLCL